MLTEKMSDVWHYVAGYQRRTGGVSPSYGEIADALGLTSRSQVRSILDNLQSRGFIARRKSHWRAITLLRWPKAPLLRWPQSRELVLVFDNDKKELVMHQK